MRNPEENPVESMESPRRNEPDPGQRPVMFLVGRAGSLGLLVHGVDAARADGVPAPHQSEGGRAA